MLKNSGMPTIVTKAGIASPTYDQLTCAVLEAIMEPTMTSVEPVAHEGNEAKMGAKKSERKNMNATTRPVRPVRPPSAIPEADSTKAVLGEQPTSEPIEMATASER